MIITARIKQHKLATFFLLVLLAVLVAAAIFIHWAMTVDKPIEREVIQLKQQRSALQLPTAQRRTETNTGCTWSDRQYWEWQGCFIGWQAVYDEQGPGTKLEQTIIDSLAKNGWRKRSAKTVIGSSAVEIYSSEASFIKRTSAGKFCAGFSHRYFSDDTQSGHRALYFYMLGPSDKGCSRW